MTLNEIIALKDTNQALFQKIFGVTRADFQMLLIWFNEDKKDDNTRKYDSQSKLALVLLARRFELRDNEIRALFFPASPQKKTGHDYAVINARFTSALSKLNNSRAEANRISLSVLRRPAYLSQNYADIDDLKNVAELCTTTTGLISAKIRTPNNQARVARFLNKPLASKSKTGQDNFLQLLQHVLRDLQEFEITSDELANYFTTLFHLFNHNASHQPYAGAGKAIQRETEHVQEYYRSQSKHTHVTFFKKMTTNNIRKQCILPRNSALQNIMVNETNIDTGETKFITRLQQYDQNGYAEDAEADTNYFTISLAHSGLRTSNPAIYNLALSNLFENQAYYPILHKLLNAELISCSPKRIPTCNPADLDARIEYVHELFRQLPNGPMVSQLLTYNLHHYRQSALKRITDHCANLNNISVETNPNSICLFIKFYPNKVTAQNSNYELGVTNVLIGFLGGLINYYLDINHTESHTQRRQSFGMHWSTLTDLDCMKARLSIGIESRGYADAVISSINTLNMLLTQFDFTDAKCPLVRAGFVVTEGARTDRVTGNEGIRFLTEMRSPTKRVHAIHCAQRHLHSQRNMANHFNAAFSAYLDDVTNERLNQEQVIPLPANPPQEQNIANREEPLFVLLGNAIKLAFYTVNNLEQNDDNQPFKYSYYHLISKLYGYCEKSCALFNTLNNISASHAYALGRHLLEHVLEYLTQLDCLKRLQLEAGETLATQIEKLTAKEEKYTRAALGLNDQTCYVYYTDSGQSASIASLYTMTLQLYQEDSISLEDTVFVDGKCYFELHDFLRKELRLKLCANASQAAIVFIDVLSINAQAAAKYCKPNVNLIILDVTHQPSISEGIVNDFIRHAIAQNKWVVLTSSMLKNEQLGLDKYQCGRITIISPSDKVLHDNVQDELNNITEAGITPVVASYFRMMNKIMREKQLVIRRAGM